MKTTPQPGDLIIDRYCPRISPEEREEAREQLRNFLRWQMKIIVREVEAEHKWKMPQGGIFSTGEGEWTASERSSNQEAPQRADFDDRPASAARPRNG